MSAIFEIQCHALKERVYSSSERNAVANVIETHGLTDTTISVRRGYRTSIYSIQNGRAKLVSTRFNNNT